MWQGCGRAEQGCAGLYVAVVCVAGAVARAVAELYVAVLYMAGAVAKAFAGAVAGVPAGLARRLLMSAVAAWNLCVRHCSARHVQLFPLMDS